MANSKRIHSLDSLEKEIYRQKLRAKSLEKKLNDNFDYLQENYGSLVKNSILKSGNSGESIVGFIIRTFVGHEKLQEVLLRVANPLADKAAHWIDQLIARMGKKNKDNQS